MVSSILRAFPDDVAAFLEGRVHHPRVVHGPLIKDIDEAGNVIIDLDHARKRPDWTFAR